MWEQTFLKAREPEDFRDCSPRGQGKPSSSLSLPSSGLHPESQESTAWQSWEASVQRTDAQKKDGA